MSLETVLSEPLRSVFAPASSFTSLYNTLSRLQGHIASAPEEAASELLTEVCRQGHPSYVADYVLEICSDPNISSTDIRHMALMNGDTVQSWLVEGTGSMVNELTGVMSGAGNIIANPALISKLSTKVAGLQVVNDALRSASLPHGGIPADQLTQCKQLLSALSWIATQGTSCGAVVDLQTLSRANNLRSAALQDSALDEHASLAQVQRDLPEDSRAVTGYPYATLLDCMQAVFLSDPHGCDEVASRTLGRSRLVLYYFWDSGINCDWRGLAEALGVGEQRALWWHALSTLERALGQQQEHQDMSGSDSQLPVHAQAAAHAAVELCLCQDIDIMLYAAQLFIALGQHDAAERIVQQCCYGRLGSGDHSIATFERLVLILLDLDDLHGALTQIRRFAKGEWTPQLHGLLYFLGNWAQEDNDKCRRFLELPFTKKEEELFEAAFPDLHKQLLGQATQAHTFWRAQVDSLQSSGASSRRATDTQTAEKTVPVRKEEPRRDHGQANPLTFETAKGSARGKSPQQRPLAALFQPDSAMNRKRQKMV